MTGLAIAKDDIAAFRIESITATGMGIAKTKDSRVFAEFTAPGELVRLRITDEKKGWLKGELLEILEPSPERIEPPCPLYTKCGGCNLQHLSYNAQLKAKESILRESFARTGGIEVPEIKVSSGSPWEYRNRVQLHCLPENRKIPGFRQRNGDTIVQLEDCPIADPGIRQALKNPANRLVPPPQKDRFTVYSKDGLFLSEGGQSRGSLFIGKNERQKELQIDAGVFFQSNFEMLEILLEDIKELAKKCDAGLPLADIFCGVGTFSAFLEDDFPQAELVEENKSAITLARKNAANKDNIFFSMKTDDWLKRRKSPNKPWGLVIVDPPRTGLSSAMRTFLAKSGTQTIAYVSCDPVTLARDSRELTAACYELKELNLYDFYPQTSHIESLAVFIKKRNEK